MQGRLGDTGLYKFNGLCCVKELIEGEEED